MADGYARNYLLPRKLANEATKGGIKQLKQKGCIERKQQEQAEQAQQMAEKLSRLSVEIKVKAGEQGKLFGSGLLKIYQICLKTAQAKCDRRKIIIAEPIKSLGNYEVNIKLAPEVETKLTVK